MIAQAARESAVDLSRIRFPRLMEPESVGRQELRSPTPTESIAHTAKASTSIA
jgi:hypothetical protein